MAVLHSFIPLFCLLVMAELGLGFPLEFPLNISSIPIIGDSDLNIKKAGSVLKEITINSKESSSIHSNAEFTEQREVKPPFLALPPGF